jgi:hypothetical protein
MTPNRLFSLALSAVAACLMVAARPSTVVAAEPEFHWYRGNTHAHTTRCGHADSEPEVVAKWYLDREYNFLCLSEHNQFIDPATVKLPDDRRKDFILVPGEEITGQNVHMTGLNMTRIVNHLIKGPNGKVIQAYTDMAREIGGTPIINHPNFRWALQVSDIRPVKNCFLFELWNAHPTVNNNGSTTRPSTEKMWDDLLTDGMLIYGVSSDDTHHLKVIDRSKSNPGRGWVMVRATELTPKAIATAMDRGEFYATNGLMLKTIDLTSQSLKIFVDEAATKHEVAKDHVIGELLAPGAAKQGYSIEFFGPAGKLLSSAEGTEATYTRDPSLAYFRARVSFVHAINGELRRHRAWTQPVFQDGRVEKTLAATATPAAPEPTKTAE